MSEKLSKSELEGLKKLQQKFAEFNIKEGEWIDELVRKQYPKFIIKLGEVSMRPPFRWVQKVIAKFSGLEITREQNIERPKKGFRKGSYKINSIKVVVKKRGKVIEEKVFEINLVVRGDLNKIMGNIK